MFAKRNACEKLHYWPTPPFNPTLYPTKVMPSTLAHDRVQSLMIERVFEFDDYMSGMDFVNAVAEIAEGANHHPEVIIGYAKVTVWLTTHDKGGLTESDFEIAARIDNLVD